MKKNYVYLLITADKFEFPVLESETIQEMSEMSGYKISNLKFAIINNSVIDSRYKLVKVDIREPEEMFTEEEYIKYCKENKLDVKSFDSIIKFKDYCYREEK